LIKIEKRLGWPDRQLLSPNGRMIWIEFKRKGEMPRKIQVHVHQMLRGMNFIVKVIDSYSEFIAVLTSLKDLPVLSGSLNHTNLEE
jgi:hypothetical protein